MLRPLPSDALAIAGMAAMKDSQSTLHHGCGCGKQRPLLATKGHEAEPFGTLCVVILPVWHAPTVGLVKAWATPKCVAGTCFGNRPVHLHICFNDCSIPGRHQGYRTKRALRLGSSCQIALPLLRQLHQARSLSPVVQMEASLRLVLPAASERTDYLLRSVGGPR